MLRKKLFQKKEYAMYPFELISEFPCGDMTAVYLWNGETVGFLIVPTAMRAVCRANLTSSRLAGRRLPVRRRRADFM